VALRRATSEGKTTPIELEYRVMRSEREVRALRSLAATAAASAGILSGCGGSMPDESANDADDMWVGEEASPTDESEYLRVSVERVGGQLSFAFEYCFHASDPVPVYEISVGESGGRWRERCRATSSRRSGDPPDIWRWTYGDASAFDLKGCESLEPNRPYTVHVESSSGCFGFVGSKQFEILEDGSIRMSGESCPRREYPRTQPIEEPTAPDP
jgi:hypothetical protein